METMGEVLEADNGEQQAYNLNQRSAKNALHRTAIPLRSIVAGELGRWPRMQP